MKNPCPLQGTDNPILLTDGSVLVGHTEFNIDDISSVSSFPDTYRLTPDAYGSYENGTWSKIQFAPGAYGGGVLADGRVIRVGGEWNG